MEVLRCPILDPVRRLEVVVLPDFGVLTALDAMVVCEGMSVSSIHFPERTLAPHPHRGSGIQTANLRKHSVSFLRQVESIRQNAPTPSLAGA